MRLRSSGAVVVVDGGKNGALGLSLGCKIVVEDVAHIVSGRALSLGAGDADAYEPVCHIIIIEPSQDHERVADITDEQIRRVDIVFVLRNIGDRTVRKGIVQVFFFKVCAFAHEQRRTADAACIIGKAGNYRFLELRADRRSGQQSGCAQCIGIFPQSMLSVHSKTPFHIINKV